MTEMERFIREYAVSIGLDPNVIMQTVLNEGGRQSLEPSGYVRRSLVGGTGAGQEPSYGPFQMHMKYLGGRALRAGYDPRDPAQAFNVAKFAMDEIKREGLGQWHGWKGDPRAAEAGSGSGANVVVPSGGSSGSYDPRMDTPSTGHPVGSTLPGPPPDPYAQPATGGAGGTFPTYTQPGGTADPRSKTQKFGDAMADAQGAQYKPTTVPELPKAALFQGQPTVVGDPQETELRKKRLAEIMARLNTGKLNLIA